MLDFFNHQKYNVRKNITMYSYNDPFWYNMGLAMAQFDGLGMRNA